MGLIRRESLTCFSAVYSYVRSNYCVPSELWSSARELTCFLGPMITLVASWARPWSGVVCAAVAGEEGFGI